MVDKLVTPRSIRELYRRVYSLDVRDNLQDEYQRALHASDAERLANLEEAFSQLDQRKAVELMGHVDELARFSRIDTFGGFNLLLTGGLKPGTGVTMNFDKGTGKILITLAGGVAYDGEDFVIIGTKVDRETGAQSPGFVENIRINSTLTTDNSTTDAQGNTVWDISDAYISRNWYTGNIFLTGTAGLNVATPNVSAYHISFEQFNDATQTEIETFDVNVLTKNTNAWLYAYLYHVNVDESLNRVNIEPVTNVSIPSGTAYTDRYWRLRRGNLALAAQTTRSGVFANIFYGRPNQDDLADLEWKLWGYQTVGEPVAVPDPPPAPRPGGPPGGEPPIPGI